MIVIGNCATCGYNSIKEVLCMIDKVLSRLGKNTYERELYYIDSKNHSTDIRLLYRYKRILSNKLFDNTYAAYSTDTIISKIKKVIYGM